MPMMCDHIGAPTRGGRPPTYGGSGRRIFYVWPMYFRDTDNEAMLEVAPGQFVSAKCCKALGLAGKRPSDARQQEAPAANKDGRRDDRSNNVGAPAGASGANRPVAEKKTRNVRPRRDRGDKKPAA